MELIKKKITNANILLISALPLALASGPAIVEIFTLLIILLFFITKGRIKIEKKDFFLFAIYFSLILSSITSEFKSHSLQSSVFLIRFILLYYILKYYFEENLLKILNFTFKILSIVFIFLLFDGFYQYFLGFSFFGTEMISEGRMVMHFRDESVMGGYLSKMLPIYLAIWSWNFKKNDFKINLAVLVLVLLTLLCIILSNERAATFFTIFFLLMVVFISNLNFQTKFFIYITTILLIFISVLYIPTVKERYLDITINEITGKNDSKITENSNELRNNNNFFNLQFDKKNIYFFSTAHEASIRTAINMFSNNLILGVGPNNFRFLCSIENYGIYSSRGCTTHPHHALSQVLSETGFVGFFFYLIVLVIIIFKILKKLFKLNLYKSSLYAFYLILFLPFLPSGNIFNNWYLFSLVLPFLYLGNIK